MSPEHLSTRQSSLDTTQPEYSVETTEGVDDMTITLVVFGVPALYVFVRDVLIPDVRDGIGVTDTVA